MSTKIYNRIVLDWDGAVIEEDSFQWDGPLTLLMPSDGAGGRSGGDGDRGSGGSTGGGGSSGGSERSGGRSFGSADAAYSRAESVAREAANRGGSSFSQITNPVRSAPTTFSGAIAEALGLQADSVFGSMGLAGAFADKDLGRSFAGYGGIAGTPDSFDLSGFWDAPFQELMGTPNYTTLDSPELANTSFTNMMDALSRLSPEQMAGALGTLGTVGMTQEKDYAPEAIAGALPGMDQEFADIADDLGLTSYDLTNNQFAKDIHSQAFNQRVGDLMSAARATSYDSVVGLAYSQLNQAAKGKNAMTPSDMKDLAEVSVMDVIGTAAKFTNPISAVSGFMDVAGYLTPNLQARRELGNLTKGVGVSRSIGSALSLANLMSGGIPGIGALGSMLSAGFGAAGYAALKDIGYSLDPMTMDSVNRALAEMGEKATSGGESSGASATRGIANTNATTVGGGSALSRGRGFYGGGESEGGTPWYFGRTKIAPFMSSDSTVIPFETDLVDEEEGPWYGTDKIGGPKRGTGKAPVSPALPGQTRSVGSN